MKKKLVAQDKERVKACIDVIFGAVEGKFTEAELAASAKVISGAFEEIGCKVVPVYWGGKVRGKGPST